MCRTDFELNNLLLFWMHAILVLVSAFQSVTASVKADVRCYCNMPACVSSGYMCKSALGVCVSDHFGYISDRGDVWRSRHGCLELFQNSRQGADLECSKEEDLVFSSLPVRICCEEDMCNYAKSETFPSSPLHRLNHSYLTGHLSNEEYFFGHGGAGNLSAQNHLWFRAAVIAVPIAGGFILILLIVVAAKILREDHKRQRRLQQQQQQQSVETRPHPHPLDTCIMYNEQPSKHQGLLFLPKSISSAIVSIHQPQEIHKGFVSSASLDNHSQLYRNVSLATSIDTTCTDSSRDKYFVFDV